MSERGHERPSVISVHASCGAFFVAIWWGHWLMETEPFPWAQNLVPSTKDRSDSLRFPTNFRISKYLKCPTVAGECLGGGDSRRCCSRCAEISPFGNRCQCGSPLHLRWSYSRRAGPAGAFAWLHKLSVCSEHPKLSYNKASAQWTQHQSIQFI